MDQLITSKLRAIGIVKQIVSKLNLDLSGYCVLTEVGSNYYQYLPIIASLAGASRVFAFTKDSKYGRGHEIKNECLSLVEELNLSGVEIYVNDLPGFCVREADIITNSGNLRPLNANFLSVAKRSVVIPLMYEKWEFRDEDLDLKWCKNNGIRVAGTWEEHPDIDVFGACGQLAVKLAHEAGYEVYGNNIIVWSNDHFGEIISEAFKSCGASRVRTTVRSAELLCDFEEVDFIFICDYDEMRPYFGESGLIDIELLRKKNQAFGVVHLYGNVDHEFLIDNAINVYPRQSGLSMVMTRTLGYLGLRPIVNLQAGGLKVAEMMLRGQEHPLVQYL